MPIYEYKCSKCGEKFEIRRGFTDSCADLKCPKCGAERPSKLISAFRTNQASETCAPTSST